MIIDSNKANVRYKGHIIIPYGKDKFSAEIDGEEIAFDSLLEARRYIDDEYELKKLTDAYYDPRTSEDDRGYIKDQINYIKSRWR